MKIIVPMAGMGKRMRPHTLTVPKPLLRIAGKSIVQRLVEDLASMCSEPLEEIAFVTGRFGSEAENMLLEVVAKLGAKGSICYQDEPLGTAHAILCAKESLEGKVIVAFADTLFRADFSIDTDADGVLYVKQIDDPSQFGVVQLNAEGQIINYIEKPKTFVSDLAMIGIYYFKDGAALRTELQYLIDNNVVKGGEYQLPDALANLTQKGSRFVPGKVNAWLDCGNKDATVDTNKQILEFHKHENWVHPETKTENSVIIQPCYIAKGCEISNSIVGPHVSLHENTVVERSVISNSIVYDNTHISGANLDNAMIGNHVQIKENAKSVSIGDYTTQHA